MTPIRCLSAPSLRNEKVSHLLLGTGASVKVFGLKWRSLIGTITDHALRLPLDPETRNMRTRSICRTKTDERLYPGHGMPKFFSELGRANEVLAVPVTAIGSDAHGTFVFRGP